MIQRIQSLHLLIVTLLMGLMFLLPLATFIYEGEIFKLYATGLKATGENVAYVASNISMTILLALSTLLPFITIFLFKRRLLQIRLCVMELIFLAGMQIYIGIYLYRSWSIIKDSATDVMAFSFADVLPIAGIVFTILAMRGIIKDQALIKSLNRIR